MKSAKGRGHPTYDTDIDSPRNSNMYGNKVYGYKGWGYGSVGEQLSCKHEDPSSDSLSHIKP